MSRAQQAAVPYLARYSGLTHGLYAYQSERSDVRKVRRGQTCTDRLGCKLGDVPSELRPHLVPTLDAPVPPQTKFRELSSNRLRGNQWGQI